MTISFPAEIERHTGDNDPDPYRLLQVDVEVELSRGDRDSFNLEKITALNGPHEFELHEDEIDRFFEFAIEEFKDASRV